jgi:hypothetical protein
MTDECESKWNESVKWQYELFIIFEMAVPWFRRLVAGLSPRSPGLVHVGLVVDKVALG